MSLLTQHIAVALIVGTCGAYALWALLPAGLRRRLATAALRWPMHPALALPLRRIAQRRGGCSCEGCGQAGTNPARTEQAVAVTFHPRRRR